MCPAHSQQLSTGEDSRCLPVGAGCVRVCWSTGRFEVWRRHRVECERFLRIVGSSGCGGRRCGRWCRRRLPSRRGMCWGRMGACWGIVSVAVRSWAYPNIRTRVRCLLSSSPRGREGKGRPTRPRQPMRLRRPKSGYHSVAAAILSGQFSRARPALRLFTRRGWALPLNVESGPQSSSRGWGPPSFVWWISVRFACLPDACRIRSRGRI